jgi:hypothetical protein
MQPQGKRHYQIDYDRGALIRETADGRRLHRYADENVWRDDHGAIVEPQHRNDDNGTA